MLLRNARIGAQCVDIAIDAGAIAAIADVSESSGRGELRGELGGFGEEIDLEGRWVSPGLWDSHVHLSQWAVLSRRLDVSGARSAREAAVLVGAALHDQSQLVGYGFRDALWPDAPNLADLDGVSGGASGSIPVVLVSADLHAVWLNSVALRRYGHPAHQTGLLREEDAFFVLQQLDTVSDEELDRWVADAASAMAVRGLVGVVDLEMTWNFETWSRRAASGFAALRVEFGTYTQHLERAIELDLHSGQRLTELVTVGPYKVITDGSLNTRTAYCVDAYPGTHHHGELTVPYDELVSLMRRASGAGLTPAVHAIGDEANRLALDAFAAVGCRGSIEHAQLVRDADFARFARLGVIASVQPEHAMDDRDVADRFWEGRTDRAFALRSLLDAGATIRLGSDAPVAPPDPWVSISAAVGRVRDGREAWHSEQGVGVAEALAASARSTIEVGQPADLVVTDLNPFTSTADDLRRMPVAATMLAGRFTHTTLVG